MNAKHRKKDSKTLALFKITQKDPLNQAIFHEENFLCQTLFLKKRLNQG